jgi:cytochrome P450
MSAPTPVDQLELPELDLDGEQSATAREEAVSAARAQHWLAKNPLFGGYTVTRYEDCVAVLRDKRWHSAVSVLVEMSSAVLPPEFVGARRESILSVEGDVHTRLRRLVAPAFSPRAADRLRPYMREVVNGLVDTFAAAGTCELVEDVCEPYPIPIICELLGAPKEDWRLFSRWATDLLRIFNGNFLEDWPLIQQASEELDEHPAPSRNRCATSAPCAAQDASPARTSSTATCCSRRAR